MCDAIFPTGRVVCSVQISFQVDKRYHIIGWPRSHGHEGGIRAHRTCGSPVRLEITGIPQEMLLKSRISVTCAEAETCWKY